jgi:serine phosphatase RsbU (regulator of sigma subunit)
MAVAWVGGMLCAEGALPGGRAAMSEPGYAEALRLVREGGEGGLDRVMAAACAPLPAWDPVVYLADFSRQVLLPLSGGPAAEDVAGTLAGRAFTSGRSVTSDQDGTVRVWVPLIEQTSRTGVLALTMPRVERDSLRQAERLGEFAGLVVAALARVSDTPHVRRWTEPMSLPACMQWDLLPPWSASFSGAVVAGVLEPAYDVAGDAFDYAADEGTLHFAIIDAMGHGLGSTVLAALTVGAYRHARRRGASIQDIHAAVDQALAGYYSDASFATGIVGTLALGTGRLEWSCAGHPAPLLLRGRKVVAELENEATLPFGLGGGPVLGSCDLEPDDSVLLYTDGVTEARAADGELFGLERLTDLVEREAASGQPPEELLRRLVRALLDHQAGGLRDDATLLLLRWGRS